MIRGTSAQFKFKLPYSYDDLSAVKIAFWQTNDKGINEIIVTKTLADCKGGDDPNELSVTLQDWETDDFSDRKKAYVQLKGRTKNNVFASEQEQITIYPMHDKIIGDDDGPNVVIPPPSNDEPTILNGGRVSGV